MANIDIPVKELENEIVRYLHEKSTKSGGKHTRPGCNLVHGNACVLATCSGDIPRATPVDYFNDRDLNIWINAEPGGKLGNIRKNPNVAIGIHDRVDHSLEQKSVQYWGKAEIITSKDNGPLVEKMLDTFGLKEAMLGMVDEMIARGVVPGSAMDSALENISRRVNLLRITPVKIILLHMKPGAGAQWKVWDEGKAYIKKAADY